jgi:hypothetical protein
LGMDSPFGDHQPRTPTRRRQPSPSQTVRTSQMREEAHSLCRTRDRGVSVNQLALGDPPLELGETILERPVRPKIKKGRTRNSNRLLALKDTDR